jgi:hypothetical protein
MEVKNSDIHNITLETDFKIDEYKGSFEIIPKIIYIEECIT